MGRAPWAPAGINVEEIAATFGAAAHPHAIPPTRR